MSAFFKWRGLWMVLGVFFGRVAVRVAIVMGIKFSLVDF